MNDTLLRDGAIPDGTILPISASLTETPSWRVDYDRALEAFSRPFMSRYASACRFGATTLAPDEIRTNFQFDAESDALPAWRDPDTSRIIRSLRENRGNISGKLRRDYPILDNPLTAQRVIEAVLTAFQDAPAPQEPATPLQEPR